MKAASLWLVLLYVGNAFASQGDVQSVYQVCVALCTDTCEAYPGNEREKAKMMSVLSGEDGGGRFGDGRPNLIPDSIGLFTQWQRVMRWDCPDECKYHCMWYAEDYWTIRGASDLKHGRSSVDHTTMQYFGKWPFVRYWHVQELMSVIFSLGNLAVVVWVFISYNNRSTPAYSVKPARRHLRGLVDDDGQLAELHPKIRSMRAVFLFSYGMHITAWFSATCFHMRDLWVTERMDYFSAAASDNAAPSPPPPVSRVLENAGG